MSKGKGKERERSEPALGGNTVEALLEEMRGLREEVDGVREGTAEMNEAVAVLRAEVRVLVTVGQALARVIESAGLDVRFIADLMHKVHGGSEGEAEDDEAKDGEEDVEKNEGAEGAGSSSRAGDAEVERDETLH